MSTNHCLERYGSTTAPLRSECPTEWRCFSILKHTPLSCKSAIRALRHSKRSIPLYLSACSFITAPSSITMIRSKLWRSPTSKSFGSWAGVILTTPLPKSFSTYSSAITGISLFVTGKRTVLPIYFWYLSSSGWTATAVSPNKVSGRVVATSR